jgi:hypothetical protein
MSEELFLRRNGKVVQYNVQLRTPRDCGGLQDKIPDALFKMMHDLKIIKPHHHRSASIPDEHQR